MIIIFLITIKCIYFIIFYVTIDDRSVPPGQITPANTPPPERESSGKYQSFDYILLSPNIHRTQDLQPNIFSHDFLLGNLKDLFRILFIDLW